ncbi:MAG: ABC transporter substrate-binding protein [Clostridia bacterium]|nr:ABC transporter substrate-binding protein [Clostridia bacterium]
MKTLKKLFSLCLLLALMVTALASCQITSGSDTSSEIRIGGLKGPTSIGMAKLMADDEASITQNDYDFTIAGTADMLTPLLIQGELDILAVPANLAATLYQRTNGEIQVLAINTLGVQYLLKKGDVKLDSLADLAGKTIYATGKNTVNEFNLRYLLAEHGLSMDSDVTVIWSSEPAEVVAKLKAEPTAIAMLPQPYVTVAASSVEGLTVALSLDEIWTSLGTDSRMITGVLVVRRSFAEKNKSKLSKFLEEYEASTTYVNEHPEEAAAWVEKYIGVKAPIATQAIPRCNITYMAGQEMYQALSAYYEVLYSVNPTSVGGKLPDKAFYYGVE